MQTESKGMAINKIQCLLGAVCLPLGTGQVALRTATVSVCSVPAACSKVGQIYPQKQRCKGFTA